MFKSSSQRSTLSATGGIFFLAIPLFYQIEWIYIFGLFDNQADRVKRYTQILPSFLKDPGNASWLFVASCVIAMILFSVCLKHSRKTMKFLCIAMLVLAGLLFLLLLFSMM